MTSTDQGATVQPGAGPQPFGARLAAAMRSRGPVCVGIDPHPELLAAWGLDDTAAGLERFCDLAVEGIAPYASMVKPQSAFFERFGHAGIAVLERVVARSREAGALVLLDVKRGDIGSTSLAYAQAYLDPASPLAVDALTASPYLGFDSLTPMYDLARRYGAGVFVLGLTSNPEAPAVQGARTAEGRTVAAGVLDGLRALNRADRPGSEAPRMGSFGAVVGATLDRPEEDLAIGGPLLAPGVGAQGGTVADVRRIFAGVTDQVVPSVSRAVLTAGPRAVELEGSIRQLNDEFRQGMS